MRRLFASPLSRSFAVMVITASTLVTVFVTSIQLWFDYKVSVNSVHQTLNQVKLSYVSSLTASLWTYDHTLVQSQLEGITNLPEIEWVELVAEDGSHWSSGDLISTYTLQDAVPLVRGAGPRSKKLGELTLLSSMDRVYWTLASKFVVILGLNLVKTLCMIVVIIYLFHRIVGRHLIDLAAHVSRLSLTERSSDFVLHDKKRASSADELDLLASSINVMRAKIQSSYDDVATYRDGLETALNKERELSSLQRQFVSMVSHEFRTPLAIIDGNAQRILRKQDRVNPTMLGGALAKIRTSVRRMTELMESVLSAAKLEDGQINFAPIECDIAALLNDICDSYRELNTGHRFIIDIDHLPSMIDADDKLLRQVFSNLLSNAVKYAPQETSIWVEARKDGQHHVAVTVRDEGVGIPESELGKLFDRFFRATTSTGIPGSGIGLHLVKHLVDLHDGRVEVSSSVGNGTTFSVHLPIHRPSAQQPQENQPPIDVDIRAPGLVPECAA